MSALVANKSPSELFLLQASLISIFPPIGLLLAAVVAMSIRIRRCYREQGTFSGEPLWYSVSCLCQETILVIVGQTYKAPWGYDWRGPLVFVQYIKESEGDQ